MRPVYATLVGTLAAACTSTWSAPAPPTPQRPTLSSDTSTTRAGTIELEAGVALDPGDSFDSPTTVKWGMSDRSELFLGWSPLQWIDRGPGNGTGTGDVTVGLRHRLFDETEALPSGAFQLTTKLPTASTSEGLGSGEIDFLAAGMLTRSFAHFSLTGFYQLGLRGDPGGDHVNVEHAGALAGTTPLATDLSGFAELAGVFQPESDLASVFGTLGLAYAAFPGVVLDAGCAVGLSEDAPDFQLLFGMTINVGGPTR